MTGKANYIDLIKKYPEQASHLAHSLCPLPELQKQVGERSSGTAFGSLTLPQRLQGPVLNAHPPVAADKVFGENFRVVRS